MALHLATYSRIPPLPTSRSTYPANIDQCNWLEVQVDLGQGQLLVMRTSFSYRSPAIAEGFDCRLYKALSVVSCHGAVIAFKVPLILDPPNQCDMGRWRPA